MSASIVMDEGGSVLQQNMLVVRDVLDLLLVVSHGQVDLLKDGRLVERLPALVKVEIRGQE